MDRYEPPFAITNRMLGLVSDISEKLGKIAAYRTLDTKPQLRRNYLAPAIEAGLVEMTAPDKPSSRRQRYRKK